MNYCRFKKIIVSLALMCVLALPVAMTSTSPAFAQSSGYSDVAQWGRYGYGYRGYYGYPSYGYRGYGYRGYYGYPYGGYNRGYYSPYYRPYSRGYYYGYPYGGYYRRQY